MASLGHGFVTTQDAFFDRLARIQFDSRLFPVAVKERACRRVLPIGVEELAYWSVDELGKEPKIIR